MPIGRAKLQGLMIKRGQTISCGLYHDEAQSDDTACNVESMETGENVKESALKRRWEINACVHQLPPCGKLACDEEYAQQCAQPQPSIHAGDSILANSALGQLQREAAQQKHERIWPEK